MSDLLALDVAVLLPRDVAQRAIDFSSALPPAEFQGLRLDDRHLPHITLTQFFARADERDQVLARVDEVLREREPMTLRVTGAGHGTNSVWFAIEKTPPLVTLHELLMEALRGLERPDGGAAAFFAGDARLRDVLWVAGYRLKSSFHHFTPHVTLGHSATAPHIEPFAFIADTIAACHLGKFCTCRDVLRAWTLTAAEVDSRPRP